MEVGYEAGSRVGNHGWEPSSHPWEVLWKAGWTKAGLRGQRIGSFMGDSGSEWNYIYLKQDRYQFPGVKKLNNKKKTAGGFGFGAEKKNRWVCVYSFWDAGLFKSVVIFGFQHLSATVVRLGPTRSSLVPSSGRNLHRETSPTSHNPLCLY